MVKSKHEEYYGYLRNNQVQIQNKTTSNYISVVYSSMGCNVLIVSLCTIVIITVSITLLDYRITVKWGMV